MIGFGKEKRAMRIMKSGRQEMTERIELSNQLEIRKLGEKLIYK